MKADREAALDIRKTAMESMSETAERKNTKKRNTNRKETIRFRNDWFFETKVRDRSRDTKIWKRSTRTSIQHAKPAVSKFVTLATADDGPTNVAYARINQ